MNDLTTSEVQVLSDDGELMVSRIAAREGQPSRLTLSPVAEQPAPDTLAKLDHALALREVLDSSWAARPVELVKIGHRLALVIEDPGGQFLQDFIGQPLPVPVLLNLALGMARVLGRLHARELLHRDIKPAKILVNVATGQAWLTGFELTSRLPRERPLPGPPEVIAGTLGYMAPEQSGRMNRSVDARSDLYSLGVTLYELCVGELPFTASDPMEWVHCHLAKLPMAPSHRRTVIPAPLSAIILKLLAKAPEERYQTASGLEADLRCCRAAWETGGRIDGFPLGASDVSDRLVVPEKLYGREKEVGQLLAAFERVVRQGAAELVLVSGYSGVGKSSVVNELHKVLVPPRGLFVSGKFDQYKRDIPYATLAQAFRTLVGQILCKSEPEVALWRHALAEALGSYGQLMVSLIPEIEHIIGRSPPPPDLPPQEAKNRFQRVLRRFVGVFARAEHPLALVLDDLQWLDTATLEFIELLAADSEIRHLLLVGAYRDNEVHAGHPLMSTLQEIRARGVSVQDIVLAPLELEDLTALVADTLHCQRDHSAPLAQLVHEKTGGNPFFATQFLTALAAEKLIAFNRASASWSWDLPRIVAKGYTDNVVELMIARLNRLPEATLDSLKHLACVGNRAATATWHLMYGETAEDLHAGLWEPLRLGLVSRTNDGYSFAHDRIQEAAYALVPVAKRAEAHLRIGKTLVARTAPSNLEENIFEIVNHLNRGAALLQSPAERQELAELNLIAGQRAKATSAFAAAAVYFNTGAASLTEDAWAHHHSLVFALTLQRAECEYMIGDLAAVKELLAILHDRASSLTERAAVTCLSADVHMSLDQPGLAVEAGLDYLRQIGIQWLQHPLDPDVDREYEAIRQRLGDRSIEELIDLPPLTHPAHSATLDVLTAVHAPANFIDGNLLALIIGRMVNLCLEHGNGDASPFTYVYAGMIMGSRFSNYREGFRFGKVGVDLLERSGRERFKARVLCNFGNSVNSWARHVRTSCEVLRRACVCAQEAGDFTFVAYNYTNYISALLGAGDPLSEVQRKAETGLSLVQQARFSTGVDLILGQLGLIRALRGQTDDLATFSRPGFDEVGFVQHLKADPGLAMPTCWYWIRKLQAYLFAGNYQAARTSASKAQVLLWTSPAFFVTADYHFYAALAWTLGMDELPAGERHSCLEALSAHRTQLAKWAEDCPENFSNRTALVEAESARIEGRPLDAMNLYEQAVQSSRENGFGHHEALANELAARFYAGRGFETIAGTYLRNARYGYLRWGAEGKVRQLDQAHPQLREERTRAPSVTISSPGMHLDVETVVKATQAISSETVLAKIIEKLVRIAVENAGAERGLLILLRGGEPRIEAQATTGNGGIEVAIQQKIVTPADLPQSILLYALRTQERVLLDDASTDQVYSTDEYVRRNRSRSVLCLPIVKQAQIAGALYLENNLVPGAFTPDRVTILQLLASQAAISLENAGLFTDLQLQVGLLHHLPVSTWTLRPDGTPDFVNQVWLDFAGHTRDFVQSHPEAWMTAVHPEDRELAARIFWEGVHTGQDFAMETRSLRAQDGTYRWHLHQAVVLRDPGGNILKFAGTTTDIDNQKRTEQALRQAQAELAHVTRVTTMGELAASIAHEINQPIAGVVINGNACLRWLARLQDESENLREARGALERIVRDGSRAGEVIARIRALFKKSEVAKEALDVNEAIRDVIVLARSEMEKRRVALRLELAPALPQIVGDRVQLQQVMLNLMLNGIEAMTSVEGRPRELIIGTRVDEERQVRVTVRDCGSGLEPGSLEPIFTAFHTTKVGGLGMGLSISRSIVENHSGRLWAKANDGPGATFQFTLPALPVSKP